ncbi:MAG: hypothetical protein HKN70_11745 [Gammaproteobacteria bacterium]|nr:hypothetical protein [Gammaproteobacteria bacterium]
MVKKTDIAAVAHQLDFLINRALELEYELRDDLDLVHPKFHTSAKNLVHYLALRQVDIRDLQQTLSFMGLSSMGRAEKNVMANLRAVRKALRKVSTGQDCDPDSEHGNFADSGIKLQQHVDSLLGPATNGRDVRIMVTLPSEAAVEYPLVSQMIASGMNIARINCAHDGSNEWQEMICNIRRASNELKRECQVVMDLAGSKIRTGALRPGPGVVRVRPKRDALGRMVAPGTIRFVPEELRWLATRRAQIPVPRDCIDYASVGDLFRYRDTRGKKRKLTVIDKDDMGLLLECPKNTYIGTGTKLKLHRREAGEKLKFRVGVLPPIEEPIILKPGDTLVLHSDGAPGEPAKIGVNQEVRKPAHISCIPAEVLRYIAAGDPVHLNDGKIEGTVTSASEKEVVVRIDFAKSTGSKLRGDKGINFPKSAIPVCGLSEADRKNLSFIVQHADAVSLSFASQPDDVLALLKELRNYPSKQPGIILKIETVAGFSNLPKLLLTAMRHYPAGVMIARGDLAVECGWVRLAEVQEEILWLCEAAQLPVIWATQVLERETKKGQPSRAEITDAAMSQRADCVMLNKGPHILSAIRMLDNILRRMQQHQHKKTPMFRKLSVSETH